MNPTTSSDFDADPEWERLDQLWRAHGPAALRFATVLVGPHDAPDIVTDAFLRVARTVGWAHVDQPHSYLLRAVRNEAHNLRRGRERQWRRDLAARPDTAEHEPTANADLVAQLARLSIEQRTVIYLAYWEDMTESAIAALLGVSAGTVHRNLVRARTQLRKALS